MSAVEQTPAESTGRTPAPAPVAVAPWHPPPNYPPPAVPRDPGSEGRAIAALMSAVFGLLLGLPLGLPGLILGPVAYFLGKSAVARIDASEGALGGRSMAVSSWVLGIVATAVGAVASLAWLVVILLAIATPTG